MMWITSLLLGLFLQQPVPVPKVVVGLIGGRQVIIENPEFTGFIQGRSPDAILTYRRQSVHGQMPTSAISRIEFGPYQKDKPFALIVTLRDGLQLELDAERQNFLTVKGKSEFGTVLINHPDPVAATLRLSTKKPDRKENLTIQYLEFPPS